MKASAFSILLFLTLLQGCAATSTVAYGMAADSKKLGCMQLPEPRRSGCLNDLRQEMDRQEQLAGEVARERDAHQPRQARSQDGVRERLEQAIDK